MTAAAVVEIQRLTVSAIVTLATDRSGEQQECESAHERNAATPHVLSSLSLRFGLNETRDGSGSPIGSSNRTPASQPSEMRRRAEWQGVARALFTGTASRRSEGLAHRYSHTPRSC